MPNKEDRIGALWIKQTRDNSEYMSGEVEIGGEKVKLVVFRNGYKDADNKPDYVIYKSRPRE